MLVRKTERFMVQYDGMKICSNDFVPLKSQVDLGLEVEPSLNAAEIFQNHPPVILPKTFHLWFGQGIYPLVNQHSFGKWTIYSEFSHEKLSIFDSYVK